ncbi:hypothetical protein TUN199_11911, partial [Pyrenophora tritici-repentis]
KRQKRVVAATGAKESSGAAPAAPTPCVEDNTKRSTAKRSCDAVGTGGAGGG